MIAFEGNQFLHGVVAFLARGAILTFEQLLLVLGPILIVASILQQLSRYIRNRIAWTLRADAYTYLTAPGVAVHELGHAFFCVIFRHRIVKMSLFHPEKDGTLGYVQHAYNPKSTYQRIGNFFIGTGPIWFGTATVYLLAQYLFMPAATVDAGSIAHSATATTSWDDLPAVIHAVAGETGRLLGEVAHAPRVTGWPLWIGIYLIFCIGSHITLSRPDVDGAARGFFFFVATLLVLNLLTLGAGGRLESSTGQLLIDYLAILYAAGLFILGVNFCLAGVVCLIYSLNRSVRG